ncbi:hypothetical protein [Bacillus sp. JAS24-2]|uniref:hypothetical protein n=1 Tax=Bacillus sp. JAS24-2 TaxID=2217832 RepID=UPI0021084C0B|nr:hypothetical protein [Bacillus sp. JAS24-2]
MSGLDELFYPDNANRKNRVEQLMAQCADLTNEIADNKIKIDKLLEMVNKTTREAYENIGIKDIQYKKVELTPDWYVTLPKSLSMMSVSLVSYRGFSILANKLAISALLKQGRIGEAALSKLVGLPKWFKFGSKVGSAAASVIVTVGIESVIDAIYGADVRGKLQSAINELAKPRIELTYIKLLSEYVITILTGIETEIKRIKRKAKKHKWTKERLEEELNDAIDDARDTLEETNDKPTRKKALNDLKQKDEILHAWTNEDPSDQKINEIVDELNKKDKK